MKIKYENNEKKQIISQIQTFMENEFEINLGELGSENLLSFFTDLIGPSIYNKGIYDARILLNESMLSIEENLFSLEKRKSMIE